VLALAALALPAAGCGTTYSDRDVQRTFHGSARSQTVLQFGSAPEFASRAAVTDLRIEPFRKAPREIYDVRDFSILRFGTADEAWHFAHDPFFAFVTIEVGEQALGPTVTIRRANLLFVGARDSVQAALARLH